MLKIGSHVSFSGKKMFAQSVLETVENGANCMMIYSGAPQNTRRKDISELNIDEAHKLLKEHNINFDDVIVHAPYIINLANSIKPETFEIATTFLEKEINRTQALGAKYLVLHPGAHVKEGTDVGIDKCIEGLNMVLKEDQDVIVCLETMAGKGSEIGTTFKDLAKIINGVKLPSKLGVCLDTCHIHDAGYDLSDFDKILDEFDEVIGLDKLKCLHINDSKNVCGAGKDRHDNLGYGHIGFDNLINIIYNERIKDLCKILETPYVNDRKVSPYKTEIEMIKNKEFNDWLDEERFIKE